MDSRSTGSVLIFARMKMFKRFSGALTYLSIAYDIQLLPTSHWPESIDAFAVYSSVTKQSIVPTNLNATSAENSMTTIENARMLSNVPIVMANTWLAHPNAQ